MKRRVVAAALGWLLVAGGPGRVARAAEPAGPRLTVSAAVERALERYPAVAAARARSAEAGAAAHEARASHGPLVKLAASGLRYDDPMVTSPIHSFSPTDFPPFDETLVQGSVQITYTVFDSGARRERLRQASAQEAAARTGLDAAEQATAARVVSSFVAALTRREVLAAQRERVDALVLEADRTRQFVAVGRAAEVETLRAEAALATAEAERTRAASALDAAERDLARLLAVDVQATRAAGLEALRVAPETPRSREEVHARALASNPQVEQARRALEAAEAGRALARSAYFPRLDAVGALQEFREGSTGFERDWHAGLSLLVPIWDGGQTGRRVARATAHREGAAAALAQAELDAREAVDRALALGEESAARSAALDRAAERLGEVARIQKLMLDVGAGTQVDYLAAEAERAALRAAATEARAAALLARVEVARLTGELDRAWIRASLEDAP